MATDIYKSVVIDGENYTIKKFTAETGLQIAKFMFSKMSALVPFLKSEETSDEQIETVLSSMSNISDTELSDLVKKCLKQCYKPLPAGLQAVMDSAGNYCIEDLEYDIIKVIKLCIEAVKWGASDFFGERGSSLMSGLMGLIG